jgi:hypothetical protein
MAVYSFMIGTYARAIYTGGSRSFTGHNGTQSIPPEYHEPVKQYASKNFTLIETDKALAENWILQSEYDETVALRTETSPTQAPTI